MDERVFAAFCAGMGALSAGQLRAVRARLRGLGAGAAVRDRLDRRGAALARCVHCRATGLQRWGATPGGLQRLRCKACRRSFCASTGTALAGIRRLAAFHAVVEDMLTPGRAPGSCRALARRLGVDKTTVWRWRMRVLAALDGAAPALGGIVEADARLVRESRKASREWVKHRRSPDIFPRPDRPRWQDWRRLGHAVPAIAAWLVPVLALAGRAGDCRAEALPDRRAATLAAALARLVGRDAVLCSAADGVVSRFARTPGLPHYRLDPAAGPLAVPRAFHLRTVTALAARLRAFLKPFRGPATRHLPRYLAWFTARLAGDETTPVRAAWHRLLAA